MTKKLIHEWGATGKGNHTGEGRGRKRRKEERRRKGVKKKANFPAGMEQKHHAVFNGYPYSERHSEAG